MRKEKKSSHETRRKTEQRKQREKKSAKETKNKFNLLKG